jgi:hypothetical protein
LQLDNGATSDDDAAYLPWHLSMRYVITLMWGYDIKTMAMVATKLIGGVKVRRYPMFNQLHSIAFGGATTCMLRWAMLLKIFVFCAIF